MLFTKDNMIVAKYASKWVLNIYKNSPVLDKTFIYCAIELIGDHKEFLDDIVDAIITNKLGKHYPDDARFYEKWCYITSYSRQSGIQNLLRLMIKYTESTQLVESIVKKALLENTENINMDLKSHSIFKSLELPDKLTNTEYELVLLLYTIINFPRIGLFIEENTRIIKDVNQFAEIMGIEDREAENAEKAVTTLGLMSYKGGKLKISPALIRF